ncbi:MAG: restriction endonuclease subunit S [Aliarcobacter sp.]|nr:restriction endonuclease subunit S [Aliarcobacter sp.]
MSNVLPQGWEEVLLKDYLDSIIDYRGKTPKKSESGIVTLSAKSVRMGFIEYDNAYYISEETYKSFMTRGFPKKGDVLITTEAPLGCISRLDRDKVGLAQRLITVRGKVNKLDNGYLLYYLQSSFGQHELTSRATGTTVQGIKRSEFEKVKLILAPINEQKRIADILSAFDDKIELNNQMNQTLEDMATTLFKEWFENFNFPNEQDKPYKDNDGEMKSSELGEIPIDWEVMKISEISENISRRFKLKEHKEVVFVNTGDVLNGEFLHKDYKNPDNLPGQAKKAIKKGDILYSEIRPKNRRFARVDIDVDDYVVSTKFMVIKRNEKIGYNCLYIYLTLDSTIELFNTIAESRSGTFPQITFDSVSNVKMTLPNNGIIMEKFEKTVEPIFEQIKLNKEQNQTLKQQRDTLLPKLMSGEIRV